MWIQLLTETLLGALTGYITNHTAIQSLFRPGGVIEQTRDDFAREAGALLEEQVLTEEILLERLQQPQVKEKLKMILENFLKKELPEFLSQKQIGDVAGAEEQLQMLQGTIRDFLERNRESLCLLVNQALDLPKLFPEKQKTKLESQLTWIVEQSLSDEQILREYLESWKEEIGTKTITELGFAPLANAVCKNLENQMPFWLKNLEEEYYEAINRALVEAMETLNMGEILVELDTYMERASIGEYLSVSSDELAEIGMTFLETSAGIRFCDILAKHIWGILSETELPLAQLLPETTVDKLSPVIHDTLPFLVNTALNWVRDHQEAISNMLDSAITEVAEEVGSMRGNLLLQLKDSMLDQLLNSDDTYVQIYEMLIHQDDSQAATVIILGKLTELLQETKLKDIAELLNRDGKLEKNLPYLIQKLLKTVLERYGSLWTAELLNWKPGSLHLAEKKGSLEQSIAEFLSHGIVQLDSNWIVSRGEAFLEKTPIGDIVTPTPENVRLLAKYVTPHLLHAGKERLENTSQYEIVTKAENLLEKWLILSGDDWLHKQADNHSFQELAAPIEEIALEHINEIADLAIQLGVKVTSGQLSELAETQIQSLSNEEMLVLVEDFMGRELQPLNYLGAAMGAGVGATVGTGLAMAIPEISAVPMAVAGAAMSGKLALFGAVGYGTNCAAVKGLFWPYEPIGGVHWAQGVIPKQKELFSHSLGQLVNRYVINPEILQEILEERGTEWTELVLGVANDPMLFQRVMDAIVSARQGLSDTAVSLLQARGRELVAVSLLQVEKMPLSVAESISFSGEKYQIAMGDMITNIAGEWIGSRTPLSEVITADTLWNIVAKYLENADLPRLGDWIETLKKESRTPGTILSESTWQRTQDSISLYVNNSLLNSSKPEKLMSAGLIRAKHYVTSLMTMHGWKTVYAWIENNFVGLLRKNQDYITKLVTDMIVSRLGMMMRMGFAMIQGDELIQRIVDRILQQKLPIFMTLQKESLEAFVKEVWQEQLAPVAEAVLEEEDLYGIARGVASAQEVQKHFILGVKDTLQLAGEQSLNSWMPLVRTDRLARMIQLPMDKGWRENKESILIDFSKIIIPWTQGIISQESLYRLTKGCEEEIPIQNLLFCSAWNDTVDCIASAGLKCIGKTCPEDYLYWREFTSEVSLQAGKLFQNRHFADWMKYELNRLIYEIAKEGERWIPVSWREEMILDFMPIVLTVMKAEGSEFLMTMDLSGLAEAQLKLMDSAHLEDVVRGFAQSYLTHIEKRGWFGAVFAIPGILLYLF